MANAAAFMPTGANASVATSTTSSAATAIPTPGNGEVVRMFNDSTSKAFVRFGDATVGAADSTDIPIAPNSVETMRKKPTDTNFRVILAAGTGTFYVGVGEGV